MRKLKYTIYERAKNQSARKSYVVNPGMVIVLKLAGGPGVLNQSSLLDGGSS